MKSVVSRKAEAMRVISDDITALQEALRLLSGEAEATREALTGPEELAGFEDVLRQLSVGGPELIQSAQELVMDYGSPHQAAKIKAVSSVLRDMTALARQVAKELRAKREKRCSEIPQKSPAVSG